MLKFLQKIKFPKIELKRPVVVVEIGNDWLKIVGGTSSPKGGRINKIYLMKLVQIKERIESVVAKTFKKMKFSRHSVILCIPRHLVTVRMLELPSTNHKEIMEMINLQVGKQTPYSKEEVVSAYKVVETEREGYTKVVLAIAQRGLVSERSKVLQKAGVSIDKVALSSEGVCNWFKAAYPQVFKKAGLFSAIAILDIDSNYSDFLIIRKEKLIFTKNIFIGANHLIEQPETWRDKFLEELKRSLERYQSEEKSAKVEKIYLSGAARNIKDMDALIAAGLGIPAENTDPLNNIVMGKEADIAADPSYRFVSITPLVGAAIAEKKVEMDLMPAEQRVVKLMEAKRSQLTIMGILVTSIVMMLSILMLIDIYNKNAFLAQLKQKIDKISNESSGVEKMRLGIRLVSQRLSAKGSSVEILTEIARLVPADINFTDIDIEENRQIVLKGRGATMSSVFKFVKVLENSPVFANVKATYATTKKERKDDKETEYAEYEIVCFYEE